MRRKAGEARLELRRDLVMGADHCIGVEHLVTDQRRHFFPPLRPRQGLQSRGDLAMALRLERGEISRGRGVERDAGAHVANLLGEPSHDPAGDPFIPKRRSMGPLTCEPSPRTNRPRDSLCRVQALCAVMVGLRGKATATAVASKTRVVACAASAITIYGSSLVSSVMTPS